MDKVVIANDLSFAVILKPDGSVLTDAYVDGAAASAVPAVDGETLSRAASDAASTFAANAGYRSPIDFRALGVEIDGLKVYRDVYYTQPLGVRPIPESGAAGSSYLLAHLGQDEYCVLGDNSPISEDSRTWSRGPSVPTRLVVGKPFIVFFSVREVDWGPWRFPVPDPSGMRYIR